ncbi:capsule biosynthesis protein [Ensifer canadensis]|uniref:capsule biosynthesis protein n=1 Tax=Ensifer canadensis TaxID=555315 RepID=UPI0035E3CCB9
MNFDPTNQKNPPTSGRKEPLTDTFVRAKSSLVSKLRNTGALRIREFGSKLIEVQPEPSTSTVGGQPGPRTQTGRKIPFSVVSFIGFVIIPFLASIAYFAFIASDQYIAEARFAVRSLAEDHTKDSVDTNMPSMSTMTQDGYVVTSFIHSTEILKRLGTSLDYRKMFSPDSADFLSRIDKTESSEEFLKYWENQVSTYVDGPSGIITLKTRTFSPEDSRQLASMIIRESEILINELSVRAQRDMTARFADEVQRSTENYRKALAALNEFQNTTGFLTPEARATETGSLLVGLLARKLELDTRLFVLKESKADSSPAHQQLVLASKNLEDQIVKLREELAGETHSDENIAGAIKTFAHLETDRRVAESLYEASEKNLEMAQAEAARKALYVVVFVPPTVPEESLYPHRWSSPFLMLLGLSVAWVTLALIWASVEDHRL